MNNKAINKSMKTKAIDIQKLAEHLKKREKKYRNLVNMCNLGTGQGQYYATSNTAAAEEIKSIIEMLRMAYKQKGPVGKYTIEYEKQKRYNN